jgi:chromosome segregation ATPase
MPGIEELLSQAFQQYGLAGLVIVFLLLGPAYTYFRTRGIRAQVEANAQSLLNEFAQKERLRSERLEERLNETFEKLNAAEGAVAQLRLQLAQAQSDLDEMPKLKQRLQVLAKRVVELERQVETKRAENQQLQLQLQQRERDSQRNAQRITELEGALQPGTHQLEGHPGTP